LKIRPHDYLNIAYQIILNGIFSYKNSIKK
jgi:hypothetical protein